jgi:hypothetical protein
MDSELQATFIVRLRRERGTPAGEWRGEVEHVQSGGLARFADQAALLAFVWSQVAEAQLQPRPPAATTDDEQRIDRAASPTRKGGT